MSIPFLHISVVCVYSKALTSWHASVGRLCSSRPSLVEPDLLNVKTCVPGVMIVITQVLLPAQISQIYSVTDICEDRFIHKYCILMIMKVVSLYVPTHNIFQFRYNCKH